MNEGENICSVCMKELSDDRGFQFLGMSVCSHCDSLLSLSELESVEPDEILFGMMDEKGGSILGTVTSLLTRTPRSTGWKVLGMAPFIGDQIKEIAQRALMESSLILMGCSIIRLGTEDDREEVSQEMITLLLVMGQYLDLSVMGKISTQRNLHQGNKLEEIILVEEHNHLLFSLLKQIDHSNDPEKKTTIARAMSMLVK
jgi:hypothetical protein